MLAASGGRRAGRPLATENGGSSDAATADKTTTIVSGTRRKRSHHSACANPRIATKTSRRERQRQEQDFIATTAGSESNSGSTPHAELLIPSAIKRNRGLFIGYAYIGSSFCLYIIP